MIKTLQKENQHSLKETKYTQPNTQNSRSVTNHQFSEQNKEKWSQYDKEYRNFVEEQDKDLNELYNVVLSLKVPKIIKYISLTQYLSLFSLSHHLV